MATFGKRIKRLREEQETIQQDFANRIGVTKATVTSWEKSGKYPSLDTAARIAQIFNVSLDWLWGAEWPTAPVTYRDMIVELISLIDLAGMETSFVKAPDDSNDNDIIQLSIKEPFYIWALKDWLKVRELYQQGTIDKDMYLTWLKGRYASLDKYLFGDDEIEMMEDVNAERIALKSRKVDPPLL